MKKQIIFLLIACAGLAGCKDFLDLPAKNERVIINVNDVKSVLGGYLRGVLNYSMETSIVGTASPGMNPLFSTDMIKMFEAYSDNIDVTRAMPMYLQPGSFMGKDDYRKLFLWNDYDTPKSIWLNYYAIVGFLNTLIDEMDEIAVTDQDEWNRVMGEMRAHRGYFLFKLLQYFAPYNDNQNGIPVYLHTGQNVLDVKLPRRPQTEVYAIILDDLLEAARLLAISAPREDFNIFYHPHRLNNILAQVYWFKAESGGKADDDYANAATYARKAVQGLDNVIPESMLDIYRALSGDLADYPAINFKTGMMMMALWPIYGASQEWGSPYGVPASQELFDLYTEGDVRLGYEQVLVIPEYNMTIKTWLGYFNKGEAVIGQAWPDALYDLNSRMVSGSNNGKVVLFRPEEAYLILAEALYHTGDIAGAVQTLNTFKGFRQAGTADGLSGEALLREIRNERRKEFFGDSDKRWLDLKKYGDVTITRDFTIDEHHHVVVEPNGWQYALPIPFEELRENRDLRQNPGWTGGEL